MLLNPTQSAIEIILALMAGKSENTIPFRLHTLLLTRELLSLDLVHLCTNVFVDCCCSQGTRSKAAMDQEGGGPFATSGIRAWNYYFLCRAVQCGTTCWWSGGNSNASTFLPVTAPYLHEYDAPLDSAIA